MLDAATPKGEQAMESILNAAENLFMSRGFNGTSMRDIAREAGYKSVAGIYNHFSDKEAIFTGLMNARSPYDEIYQTIQELGADTGEDFVHEVFFTLTTMMQRHINFIRLVMLDYLEFNAVHVQQLIEGFQRQIFGIYAKFENTSDLRQDMPPIALMRVIAIQVFGYMMTTLIMPQTVLSTLPEEQWKAIMMDVLANGILKEDK
jgi:AcrR family transcriptional regulator